jgi:phosphoribosylanthranilate isomerase
MRVKICGITRMEDALAAADAGADAVGFIFYRSSTRYIAPADAAKIIEKLPPFVCPVGVFVNAGREEIARTILLTGIRCLQLHGDEAPGEALGYTLPVIKSFRAAPGFDASVIASYKLTAFLLDASVPGMYGGTGKTFDWEMARDASRYGRVILSGGITPANVADAVRTVKPYAVDVSSGVESSPGVKDRGRIRLLFENVRST